MDLITEYSTFKLDNNVINDKKTLELDLYKKLENELSHLMRCLNLVLIFIIKRSLLFFLKFFSSIEKITN